MPPIISLAIFVALLNAVNACCPAWRSGAPPVKIAAQEVLIVWDEEQGVEHFIRRADFKSNDSPNDFGFLVPTPTQPKLSETPDAVFNQLNDLTKPEIKIENKTNFTYIPLFLSLIPSKILPRYVDMSSSKLAAASVQLLEHTTVGGFDVAVLRASDTESLLQWLQENNYDARPELREWVSPYVKKNWVITAFKYSEGVNQENSILSRASVCLSFKTQKPFFPYRVPSDIRVAPENGSLLRLFFAGTERVTGEFEAGENRTWNASAKYSNQSEKMTGILKDIAPLSESGTNPPNALWLTAFEDNTWPGGAEDLYFQPSSTEDAITPPPIIRIKTATHNIPTDLVLFVVLVGCNYYRKKRELKAAA